MKSIKKYKPRRHIGGKQFNPKKESAREKGYDKDWERYRFRFLHYNKKCYVCSKDAKVVDHCVPAKVDRDKYFWNVSNFLPMCTSCHNYATGKFDRHSSPKTEDKMKWIQKERTERGVNVRVRIVPLKKGSGLGC